MTPPALRFAPAFLAAPVLAIGLVACNAQPDARAEASASASAKATPDAAALARSEALAQREQAQLAWLKKTLDVPAHAQVYEAAVGQSRGRAAHCPTQRCIETGLRRRETRLNFAEGKPARIPGLPFPSGQFSRDEAGFSGPVRIVPLIDGKAMLVIALSFKGRPSCTMDGVMTRDDGTNTWTVTSLDEGLPTMVLTPGDEKTFSLSYAEAGHQPYQVDYCTQGTSIDGKYRLAG